MADLPKVAQLAGPGVEGFETDPPLYHFDLEPPQVFEMAANPVGFLEQLGLNRDKGIAPKGRVTVRMPDPTLQWSHKEQMWVQAQAGFQAGAVKGCCYVSDDEVICHVHQVQ
jgi:hypothetical protein